MNSSVYMPPATYVLNKQIAAAIVDFSVSLKLVPLPIEVAAALTCWARNDKPPTAIANHQPNRRTQFRQRTISSTTLANQPMSSFLSICFGLLAVLTALQKNSIKGCRGQAWLA